MEKEVSYFEKMKGLGRSGPRQSNHYILWSFLTAVVSIGILAFVHYEILLDQGIAFIIAPFGATAVLSCGAIEAPLAQPRNIIGGHIISAIVGVTCFKLFGSTSMWIAATLGVSLAIVAMLFTNTVHPPGGATALFAVMTEQSYIYVLRPVATGAIIMVAVAVIMNNIPKGRRYPQFWI